MKDDTEPRVKHAVLTAQFITASFMATVVILCVVCWFMLQGAPAEPGASQEVCWALTAVGIGALGVAHFLGGALLAQFRGTGHSMRPAAAEGVPDQARVVSVFILAAIVCNATREAAGILGFVASFLGRDLSYVLGLSTAALIAMILSFPRREALERLLKQQ